MEGFRWILQGRLAGSAQPGLMTALEADLAYLQRFGIQRVVSLRRDPPSDEIVASLAPLVVDHFPIDDMGAPTPRRAYEVCNDLVQGFESVGPTLIHCRAGLGRTGTIAAAVVLTLREEGITSADKAITRIRSISPHYIQSGFQVSFLSHYAEFLNQQESADAD